MPFHRSSFWNIPNSLSLSRLPLSVMLFIGIAAQLWLMSLMVFLAAALTDWLDGWWARRYGQATAIGRALDPLTDKVLTAGAFIFLIPVSESGIHPWMATVVVTRELLITGLRGIVESTGQTFGADWFGKLKTVLQFIVLIGVLLLMTLRGYPEAEFVVRFLDPIQFGFLYGMLAATIGSGVQYTFKASRLLA